MPRTGYFSIKAGHVCKKTGGESWENVTGGACEPAISRNVITPKLGVLSEARGGDRGAGGTSSSYGAASTQSSGGGHAVYGTR